MGVRCCCRLGQTCLGLGGWGWSVSALLGRNAKDKCLGARMEASEVKLGGRFRSGS